MTQETPSYNDIPLSTVLETIRAVAAQGDNPELIMPMTSALGIYIEKLQAGSKPIAIDVEI